MSTNHVFFVEQTLPLGSLLPGRYYKPCPVSESDFRYIFGGGRQANRSQESYLRGSRQHPLTDALKALGFKPGMLNRRAEELPGVTLQFFLNSRVPDEPSLPLYERAKMRMIPDTRFNSRFEFMLSMGGMAIAVPDDPVQAALTFAHTAEAQRRFNEEDVAHVAERTAPSLYLVAGTDVDLLQVVPANILFSRQEVTELELPAVASETSPFIPAPDAFFEVGTPAVAADRLAALRTVLLAGRALIPLIRPDLREHLFVAGDRILIIPESPSATMSFIRVETEVDLMRRMLGTNPIVFGVVPPPTPPTDAN